MLARLVQSPFSPHGDHHIISRIENGLERTKEDLNNGSGNVLYFHEWHEIVEPEYKPAARWFLLLVLLDAEQWQEALACLARIFKDIETNVWPRYYLVEALHFASLINFALSERETCTKMNRLYQAYAHPLDRHRFESEILQLWTDQTSSSDFLDAIAKEGSLNQMWERLSRTWSPSMVSSTPWVLSKVANSLGAEYESPYTPIVKLLEQQWSKLGGPPPHVRSSIEEFQRCGYPHGVTVRYRKSQADERRENEEYEKRLQMMYEDRY